MRDFKPLTEEEIENWRSLHVQEADAMAWKYPAAVIAESKRQSGTLCDMALASLSLPSPCGHPSQYTYSEDGGKVIACLLCERVARSTARETPVEWHRREKAAFDAWWESRGPHKMTEPPSLAAGAAWFARAELAPVSARNTIAVPREQLAEWALWLKGRREVAGQVALDSIEEAIKEHLARSDGSSHG